MAPKKSGASRNSLCGSFEVDPVPNLITHYKHSLVKKFSVKFFIHPKLGFMDRYTNLYSID